jgi:spore germination protein KC
MTLTRRWGACVALALLPVLCGGCWTSREINSRGIIIAAAFDRAETPEEIMVTVQLINPSKARQGGPDAVLIASAVGTTLFEASKRMLRQVGRKPFWGQTQVLILSEELARAGISRHLDFLERDFEPNRRVWMLIARDVKAADILRAWWGFNAIPGTNITDLIGNARLGGQSQVSNLNEMIKMIESQGITPLTGCIELSGAPSPGDEVEQRLKPIMNGTAIIVHDRLVGYLDERLSRGVGWVRNTVENTAVVIRESAGPVAIEIVAATGNVKVKLQDGQPVFTVAIELDAHIAEVMARAFDPTKVDMNDRVAAVVKQEVIDAIAAIKGLRADVLGLGNTLQRKYPRVWDIVKDTWHDEYFPVVKIDVEVQVKTHISGFLFHPQQAE